MKPKMKLSSIKRFLQNKWMVPISALILSLCIGSLAVAATSPQSGSGYSFPPYTSSSATTTTQQAASVSSTTLPGIGYQTTPITVYGAALSEAELAVEQAKENAILDLIREKMTAEDKVVFDQLRVIASQQQMAVSKAQTDLQSTKAQITALIDKYLGVLNGANVNLVNATSGTTIPNRHLPE